MAECAGDSARYMHEVEEDGRRLRAVVTRERLRECTREAHRMRRMGYAISPVPDRDVVHGQKLKR